MIRLPLPKVSPLDHATHGVSNRWRTSLITFGNVDIGGNPKYAPSNPDEFPYTAISGRDMELHGTPGGGSQEACDSTSTTCFDDVTGAIPFAGIFGTHEHLEISGNAGIDGFMIAEDSADCADLVAKDESGISTTSGSVGVRYDCDNPENPWAILSVTLRGWEEIQTGM